MTNGHPPRCPVCDSADVRACGAPAYRQPTRVAGVPVDLSDLHLAHYRCAACTYQFVYPRIPLDRLLACYRDAAAGHWTTDHTIAENRAYHVKRDLLERYAPGRRVLDFGCYDGGFLDYLGPTWDRAGIEPSADAANAARARGIPVIAPTAESVDPSHRGTFSAVIVFDVMEHLPDPVATLASLARLLEPGGIMLIETGDTDTPTWRLLGRRYWYCGLPEHVGFFNKRSIAEAARRAGMRLERFDRSTQNKAFFSPRRRLASAFVCAAYCSLRTVDALGLPVPNALAQVARGAMPGALDAGDHFLAVLRRPA